MYTGLITALMQQVIEETLVMVLTGKRQVGKSTLYINEPPFRDWRFVSIDDQDVLLLANH